jgi:peptidoglycan hydrolase-like protein with peptidoglycan-binding domain
VRDISAFKLARPTNVGTVTRTIQMSLVNPAIDSSKFASKQGWVHRRAAKLALLLLFVAVAGVSVWRAEGTGPTKVSTTLPPNLTTVPIVRRDLADQSDVSGTIVYEDIGRQLINQLSGIITSIPKEGTVIRRGQALFEVNNTPVVLMYGNLPAWRSLSNGVRGPDVKQFEENLIALGDRTLIADGNFTWADANAVRRWQQGLGLPRTGSVELGRVAFLPGPIRIESQTIALGSIASAGAQPITITSVNRIVVAQVEANLAQQLRPGDTVAITFPDGKATTGAISKIAPLVSSQPGGSAANSPAASANLTITSDLSGFNGSTVTVGLTLKSVKGVLAVPITALLALAEGGYGVEILDANDRRRLVPAQTGLFDERANLVQVSGPDLAEGVRVVIPSQT